MNIIIPWNEIEVIATRSSGAGGQHVNKTNSAIQLRFSISNSLVLSEDFKKLLFIKLKNKMNKDGELLIRIENERDQKSNKEEAYTILNKIINEALKVEKKRIPTKPKKGSIKKRLESKKNRAEIKKSRSKKITWS